MHMATDEFLIYNYYNSIKYLDLLSDRLSGRLLQQYMHTTMNDYNDRIKYASKNELTSLISLSAGSFESIIDETKTLMSMAANNTRVHGFGHPDKGTHDAFAQHIYDKLV